MKKVMLTIALIWSCCLYINAQSKLPPIDKSPMDMAYYPAGYPVLKIQDKITEPLIARVIYSRPQKSGRTIFGQLLEYGKLWRLGANEATEIEFFKPVRIGGTKIKKGRYTLYCIPNADTWTILVNKDTDIWGSFKYDESKTIATVNLPVHKQNEMQEHFVMAFEKSPNGAILTMAWEDISVNLPISF